MEKNVNEKTQDYMYLKRKYVSPCWFAVRICFVLSLQRQREVKKEYKMNEKKHKKKFEK